MSKELICTYPDPVLRRETVLVTEFDDELVSLVEKMKEIMLENDGVGLAGPQIGLSLKIAVVFYEGVLYPLINPVILESEGSQSGEEGCLSFPDIYGNVTRPQSVKVRTADLDGQIKEIEAEGFLARAFCHEIDHLNGKLLIDHFSPLKKSMARKKMLKRRREK
jgi:peptide deformylase